MTFRAEFSIKI